VSVVSLVPRLRAREEATEHPEAYENARQLNSILLHRLRFNDLQSVPPKAGVRYVAGAVRADQPYLSIAYQGTRYPVFTWRLLAVAIGHIEGGGVVEGHDVREFVEGCRTSAGFVLDVLLRDTDTDAIVPLLRTYGLYKLTDWRVEEVNLPLAEAWGLTYQLAHRPPKKPEFQSWREMLVHEALVDVCWSHQERWEKCWEKCGDGPRVLMRDLPYDEDRVADLLERARGHFQDGNLDDARDYCDQAERAMLERRA
jgi:hypothetical protein